MLFDLAQHLAHISLTSRSDPHQLKCYLSYILTFYLAFYLTYFLTFFLAFYLISLWSFFVVEVRRGTL